MTTQVQIVGREEAGFAERAGRWIGSPTFIRRVAAVAIVFAVVGATGGPSTFGFWFVAVTGYALMVFGSMMTGIGFLLLMPLVPIFWLVNKFRPGWGDRFTGPASYVLMLVPGALYFVYEAPMDGSGVRLPTEDPNLGALIVMGAAGLLWLCVSRVAARLEPAPVVVPTYRPVVPTPTPPVASRPSSPPEPEEELWSSEPVVGWRVWSWSENSLRGFRLEWRSPLMVATCENCADPPGWGCSCGIYAVKDRNDLWRFGQTPTVVGKVEMWGDVVEHERGYRASHARITDLWVPSEEDSRHIAAMYPEVRVRWGAPSDDQGE